MIKALIFDLDNTLIDRKRAFVEMLQDNLSKYWDKQTVDKMIEDILIYDKNGSVPRKIAFRKWADKYKVTEIDPDLLADNWSKSSGSVAYLFDDVRETLSILKKQYKIGILSNGASSSQRRKMKTIAIDDLIDYSLISSEYGIEKPDKSVYQYVCKQMGFLPEECIYIGDSYTIDIEGSINAGLKAIYVDRINDVRHDVTTIHQIKDLLDIL